MTERSTDVRRRIMRAATNLLVRGGRRALTTRAASAAAGVQAPTIYRHFGDMQGLLEAVVHEIVAEYVREMADHGRADDPLEELRRGWDMHVAFGLANPAAYALIYADPTITTGAQEARDDLAILRRLVERIAEAGLLRVSVPLAQRLLAAAGTGVTLLLISTPPEARDLRLSATMREAVLATICTNSASADLTHEPRGLERVATRAVALRAVLAEAPGIFSQAEQHLLREWLDRITAAGG